MRKVKEYSLEEQLELYKTMVEAQPQSMFLMDKDKNLIGIFNAAPETLAGYTIDDIIGNNILKYVNDPDSPFHQACSMLNTTFDPVFKTGNPLKFQYMILDTYLEATITKISKERILSQVRDITDIVLKLKDIEQKKRNELSIALIAGGVTSWSYDVEKQVISSTHENDVIQNCMPIEQLYSLIIPEHRQKTKQMFDNIINRQCTHAHVIVQVMDFKGKIQWADIHAVPHEYSPEGKVTLIIGSQKNVTTEYENNEKLKQAKEKAEQSDRLKTAFLANMSHEIRTPLNSIVGFSQLLPEAREPDEQIEYIDIINTNSQILLNLINDILDLSKIEAGYFACNNEEFDLCNLFNQLNVTFKSKVRPNVNLICEIPSESFLVKLDRMRISQIITNFVTNSIKFTRKGHIKMGFTQMNDHVKIYVEDTGKGMSQKQVQNVFDRFEKFDSFEQGTGLGTSIAKAIVDAYKGKIEVESTLNAGTTFWAILPIIADTNRTE